MSINTTDPTRPWIRKDPDASLDYSWDWTAWLSAISDSISSFSIVIDAAGLTAGTPTHASGVVTATLSAGTAGTTYRATCRITTAAGRIEDRSIWIKVAER